MYLEYILIFATVKHLLVFCRSCNYTVTPKIFLSLQQFFILSTPNFANFAKLGEDINRMEELFYEIFVLNDSVFCTFCFLFSFGCCCCFFFWRLQNIRHCFLPEVEIKVVLILKIYCFLLARFFMIAEFKRVSIVRSLALLTRVLNVWLRALIEFTYSYATREKNRSSCSIGFAREVWRRIQSSGCTFFYTVLPKVSLHATATRNGRILKR